MAEGISLIAAILKQNRCMDEVSKGRRDKTGFIEMVLTAVQQVQVQNGEQISFLCRSPVPCSQFFSIEQEIASSLQGRYDKDAMYNVNKRKNNFTLQNYSYR